LCLDRKEGRKEVYIHTYIHTYKPQHPPKLREPCDYQIFITLRLLRLTLKRIRIKRGNEVWGKRREEKRREIRQVKWERIEEVLFTYSITVMGVRVRVRVCVREKLSVDE